MGHIGTYVANFINHVRLKNGKSIPNHQGVRVTKRSEVIAFPAKNRLRDIQRCVQMLGNLHGIEANSFWRDECRALAAHLTNLGYDDAAMRHEVMEFQDAVQMQLWSLSQPEEAIRV
ncbi:DUF6074 family protein [Agrobacterium larrymoorei]|uniref:DUF6074 family protein n=1 Tax=Agrobacterium larrymoorei TaxID=160699 RepID=UPI001F309543|nr:DUF6074 family protein [Agrobacterium larrymoorei]